jgi:hypothetical protein
VLADGLVEGQRTMGNMLANVANDDFVRRHTTTRLCGALSMRWVDPVLPTAL